MQASWEPVQHVPEALLSCFDETLYNNPRQDVPTFPALGGTSAAAHGLE